MSGSASAAGGGLDALLPPEMARRAEEVGVQKACMDAVGTFTLARMFWSRVERSGSLPAGLFVGPVVISLLLVIWREWTEAEP